MVPILSQINPVHTISPFECELIYFYKYYLWCLRKVTSENNRQAEAQVKTQDRKV
jgi:hypothetical protein